MSLDNLAVIWAMTLFQSAPTTEVLDDASALSLEVNVQLAACSTVVQGQVLSDLLKTVAKSELGFTKTLL